MGAQLNIKDPETIRLARQLADRTGDSITAVIRAALEREVAEREAEVDRIWNRAREISASFRANMPADWHGKTSRQIMDEIHDEYGVPG